MSYFKPFIDEAGIHIPSYDQIKSSLIDEMKIIYGSDIHLTEDTQDYQLISAFSLMLSDAMQSLLLAYNNNSPATAVGRGLDRLVALNGIQRRSPTRSTCVVKIEGARGTTIKNGVVQDVNGIKWNLPTTVIIPVEEEGTVTAICTDFGPIQVPVGGITEIITPVKGWASVTNEAVAILGSGEETDSELRERQAISASASARSNFDSIWAGLLDIDGVLKVTGYENDTSEVVDGYPPNSVTFCVEGGKPEEIAIEIYKRKTLGVYTHGDQSVAITGEFGNVTDIKFQRPVVVPAIVDLSITSLPSYNSSILDVIKDNLVNYLKTVKIGEDVYVSNLYGPVANAMSTYDTPPFYITNLTLNSELVFLTLADFDLLSVEASNVNITVI